MGIHGYTGFYEGLQGYTGIYSDIQGYTDDEMSPQGLLPAPPPPTKCPQFFAHQSQYSKIVRRRQTMHRSQHFVRPLSRRRASGDGKGSKVATTVRRNGNQTTRPIQHQHSQTLVQSQLDLFTFERVGDVGMWTRLGSQARQDWCHLMAGQKFDDLFKAMLTS